MFLLQFGTWHYCCLEIALKWFDRWQVQPFLVGNRSMLVDLTAAALLSLRAQLSDYRQQYLWLFDRMRKIHAGCHELLPLGLEDA